MYANTRMRRIRTAISKLAPQMTHQGASSKDKKKKQLDEERFTR